jgi:hypothetical protein
MARLGPRRRSVGRLHGESSRTDAGLADHDQRAGGQVLGDLPEVREDDRSQGAGSSVSAAEQDDARC